MFRRFVLPVVLSNQQPSYIIAYSSEWIRPRKYINGTTHTHTHTHTIIDNEGGEGAESYYAPNGAIMVSTTAANPCKDKIDAYFDCLGFSFKTCISMSWILSGSTLGDITCETLSSSNFAWDLILVRVWRHNGICAD